MYRPIKYCDEIVNNNQKLSMANIHKISIKSSHKSFSQKQVMSQLLLCWRSEKTRDAPQGKVLYNVEGCQNPTRSCSVHKLEIPPLNRSMLDRSKVGS